VKDIYAVFVFFVLGKVQNKGGKKRKSAFDQELTNTGKNAIKKFRSG
jgi:hypothetical protein